MTALTWAALILVIAAAIFNIAGRLARSNFVYKHSLVIMIGAVFVALVMVYLPVARWKYLEAYPDAGGFFMGIAILIQSVQSAFRTFVLDGEWSDFLSSGMDIPFSATIIGVILNVIAPVLTFSAILSLFKEIRARWRVWKFSRFSRHMVIMSELNKDSITLAEDIIRLNKRTRIVFTDVFPRDDESNFELKEKAVKLNAVFLRSDISELNIPERNGLTEYFLTGHSEEENVMQAEKLFRKNQKRKNVRIFVRAVHKGNALILDSLNSSLEINDKASDGHELSYEETKDLIRTGGVLKFRRFDPEKEVAWNEIPAMNFIRKAFALPDNGSSDRKLSILLDADTHLGFTMAKTLLWYCQSDKFRLALNIVYTDKSKLAAVSDESESWPADIKHLLETECPGIISTSGKLTDGDAYYDIAFYEKDEFSRLHAAYLRDELYDQDDRLRWNRIEQTDGMIIDCMRDVDAVEIASKARTAFERAGIKPEIYAVCTDDEDILTELNSGGSLSTHKNERYDIRFIGKRSDIYSYHSFVNTEAEELGYCQHIKWVDVGGQREYLKDQLISYEKREYFREASMSKAMFLRNVIADPEKELTADEVRSTTSLDENSLFERRLVFRSGYECLNAPSQPSDRWRCTCAHCMRRRRLEHNRWNAYMRTLGFISRPSDDIKTNKPLAGIHGNIVSFGELERKMPQAIEKDS